MISAADGMELDETITLDQFDSLLVLADALAIQNVRHHGTKSGGNKQRHHSTQDRDTMAQKVEAINRDAIAHRTETPQHKM